MLIQSAEVDERINAAWPAYETALKAANVRYERHPLSRHAARLQQRHDAALRRRRGQARVGAHLGAFQQEFALVPPVDSEILHDPGRGAGGVAGLGDPHHASERPLRSQTLLFARSDRRRWRRRGRGAWCTSLTTTASPAVTAPAAATPTAAAGGGRDVVAEPTAEHAPRVAVRGQLPQLSSGARHRHHPHSRAWPTNPRTRRRRCRQSRGAGITSLHTAILLTPRASSDPVARIPDNRIPDPRLPVSVVRRRQTLAKN